MRHMNQIGSNPHMMHCLTPFFESLSLSLFFRVAKATAVRVYKIIGQE